MLLIQINPGLINQSVLQLLGRGGGRSGSLVRRFLKHVSIPPVHAPTMRRSRPMHRTHARMHIRHLHRPVFAVSMRLGTGCCLSFRHRPGMRMIAIRECSSTSTD